MEEPKNPCKTCGGAGTPSRREFLQKAAAIGAGVALTGVALTAPLEAKAAGFDFEACVGAAHDAWVDCRAGALQPAGNSVQNRAIRFAKRVAYDAAFDAHIASCDAQLAAAIAAEIIMLPFKPGSPTFPITAGGIIIIIIIVVGSPILI